LILTGAILLAGTLSAQDGPPPVNLFPAEVGRTWTYTLTLKAGANEKKIEYTTKVDRTEDVEGVGTCAVFVSRSAERRLNEAWFELDGTKVSNPQYKGGKRTDQIQVFTGHVLIDTARLGELKGEDPKKPTWSYTSSNGSTGTVTLERRERLFIPKVGDLPGCLVVKDEAVYEKGTAAEKKVVRVTTRTLWFAPNIGLVKEVFVVTKPDGTVTFETEAVLTRFQAP
jgi:hypothetical protein